MELGVYESLLTGKLFRTLTENGELYPEYQSVDDAEQPIAIARHLAPIIERSMRVARTADDRAELTRRILAVLPDVDGDNEALYSNEPGKMTRLDEVASAVGLASPSPASASDAVL